MKPGEVRSALSRQQTQDGSASWLPELATAADGGPAVLLNSGEQE
jgi:hypothetical protein